MQLRSSLVQNSWILSRSPWISFAMSHSSCTSFSNFQLCLNIDMQKRTATQVQSGSRNLVQTSRLIFYHLKNLTRKVPYKAEVESSRTHFGVLGLEASSPWPWPRSLRSSKIVLSSARGQHYFLNR